jgi:Zn-dependent protease
MFISPREIFDILLMTGLLGFIFNDTFGVRPRKKKIDDLPLPPKAGFNWDGFFFAAAVIAPSVILHELSHKFVAIATGHSATFHAFYADTFTLILGLFAIVAKFVGWGFIFFIPGFVQIANITDPGQAAIISFAGPAIHLIFWIGPFIILKTRKSMKRKTMMALVVMQKVNMFLFILNMLPIPGIDGWSVYSNLYRVFF